MSLDANECLGCSYIYPSNQIDFDVEAFYWMRKDYLDNGLETPLGLAFQSWLKTDWPFSKIDYLGRNL